MKLPGQIYRLLLALFTLLSLGGLWANGMFSLNIWEGSGLPRLVGYTGLYALIVFCVLVARPAAVAPVVVALAAAYSALEVGPVAVATPLLILLAAWSLGRLVWVRFARREPESGLAALMIGFVLYVGGLLVTGGLRIHYVGVYLALLALPLICNWRAALALPRKLVRSYCTWSTAETVAFAVLCYVLSLHWLMALKPEVSSDGLAMHLVLPAQVAFRHYWPYDFRLFVWAVMPAAGDWAFTLAYLPGGEFAARLLNFSFLAVTAGMVVVLLCKRLSLVRACLLAALFVSTPLVQMEAGNLMVEPFWAAVLMAAAVALDQEGRAWLLAAAALAGFGLSCKFGSLSFSLVLLGCVLVKLRRREASWHWMAGAVGLFLLLGVWPYANAWRLTGSPIFPFLNAVLRSPYFEPHNFADNRFRSPLSWRTLYDVTFHSRRYLEGQPGALGFQWLWLLPALAVAARRDWLARALGICALVGWVATFLGQAYLRYIFPALPLLTVVMGIGWREIEETDRRLDRAVWSLVLLLTGLNVYFLASSSWYHKDFLLTPFNAAARAAYVTEGAPARPLIAMVNQAGEAEPKVAFFEENGIGELRGTAYTNTWHSNEFVWQMRKPTNPVEALLLYRRWNIDWFIVPKDPGATTLVYAARFLETYCDKVGESGVLQLWRLREQFRRMSVDEALRIYRDSLPTGITGLYDDASARIAFNGPWIRDRQFREPVSGTVSYCAKRECAIEFRFSGRSLDWLYTAAPNRGKASIEIDGARQVVDQYSPKVEWRKRLRFPLAEGSHHAVVRVLGQKQPAATDVFIDLDAFEVN